VVGYFIDNLDLNKRSVIITDIIAPMYPSLQILYLGDNNIANIEQLILLNAQKLQKLYLSKIIMLLR